MCDSLLVSVLQRTKVHLSLCIGRERRRKTKRERGKEEGKKGEGEILRMVYMIFGVRKSKISRVGW